MSLRGADREGHEWRGREGVAGGLGRTPEGTENSRGDRIVGRANPSAKWSRIVIRRKALKARQLELVSLTSVDGRRRLENVMRARCFDEEHRLGSRETP